MQLLNIQEHQILQQAVDAKELYNKLGLHSAHWSKWRQRNIDTNDFAIETVDYMTFTQEVRGNLTINYLLSIDLAKKLAMQVRTKEGEQVRNYFLECERKAQAQQPVTPAIPQSFSEALLLAGKLQQQIEQNAPKVAHYDAVADRKTLLNATQVAQSVGIKSAQALNKRLSQVGVYNANCKRGKAFQAWFIQRGLGEMKQGDTGHMQPLFTTKGQMWVYELLSKEVA